MLLNTNQDNVSFGDLREATTSELLALFRELEAPGIDELHGDYDATLLKQPSKSATVGGFFAVGLPFMPWLSKGFRPATDSEGRGYNSFRLAGKVVQRYP